MASQLRLRVVLPIAVLGVLGLGVGAFAFGGGPSDEGALPPATTTQAGTTTTPGTQPQGVPRATWAKEANAWCADIDARLSVVEHPRTPAGNLARFEELVQVLGSAQTTFTELGWPQGKRQLVVTLRKDFARVATASHRVLAAVQSRDQAAAQAALKQLEGLNADWDRAFRSLGARKCLEDALDTSPAKTASPRVKTLKEALERKRVVVVLFYAPGDSYDTIQTRETRAGAIAAGAGFLALNVHKNRQIAALAAEYDVRDAPATLVFTRGPRVVYRVTGYMDRQAVAQAAADAFS